jgi:hypothetical protein
MWQFGGWRSRFFVIKIPVAIARIDIPPKVEGNRQKQCLPNLGKNRNIYTKLRFSVLKSSASIFQSLLFSFPTSLAMIVSLFSRHSGGISPDRIRGAFTPSYMRLEIEYYIHFYK